MAVNFVLHFHAAERHMQSPVAGAAAALVDLWAISDRRARPRPAEVRATSSPPALVDASAGLKHHVACDRWFHETGAFKEGERALRAAFRKSSAPKIGLFAHMAWEMMLDGALLRQRTASAVKETLRQPLRLLSTPECTLALLAPLQRFEVAERDAFFGRLSRIVDAVTDGPWIDGYQHAEGLAERLGGVRRGLGLPSPSASDIAAWRDAFESLESAADRALLQLERADFGRSAGNGP